MTEVRPPLLRPAGAYHSYPTLSLNAITPGITTEGGTQTYLFVFASFIFTQG